MYIDCIWETSFSLVTLSHWVENISHITSLKVIVVLLKKVFWIKLLKLVYKDFLFRTRGKKNTYLNLTMVVGFVVYREMTDLYTF